MKPAADATPESPLPLNPTLERTLATAFLENVPDHLFFKDLESRFIAVSRSKAKGHGLEPKDLVGRTEDEFFAAEHAQWARVDEENIVSTGQPIVRKLERLTWADGHQTWALTSKLPLRDEMGEIIGTMGLSQDVTEDQEMKQRLEKAKRELVDTSRTAGMAEVATGVLHNVGNVLTSLNVSASVIASNLRQSKAESLAKLATLLAEHSDDLGGFLATGPKGRRVPEFLESLAKNAQQERDLLLKEIASLQANIDHIKDIVTMQQAYATTMGVVEPLEPVALMEDAIRMNAAALVRHDVAVVRDFQTTPRVLAEKGKVLQILVNLIRNAKYAADDGGRAEKIVTLRVEMNAAGRVSLVVQDNGVGIAPENLTKIFNHGFTTRAYGHGFGLHSSLAAAEDMKGKLYAQSEGIGHGATFTLELPVASEGAIPAPATAA